MWNLEPTVQKGALEPLVQKGALEPPVQKGALNSIFKVEPKMNPKSCMQMGTWRWNISFDKNEPLNTKNLTIKASQNKK